MKPIISTLILSFVIFSNQLLAQIPNSSFEFWEEQGFMGVTANNPKGWFTSNLYMEMAGLELPVTETTGRSGKAISIKTVIDDEGNPASGFVTSLRDTSVSFLEFDQTRFPMGVRPEKFKGYFKYLLPNGSDSFTIYMEFYKEGTPIGSAEYTYGEETTDFTAFEINVDYFQNDVPDSAIITFLSSTGEVPKVGSELIIDDLEVSGGTVSTLKPNQLNLATQVYPNPASGSLTVEITENTEETVQIELINIIGVSVKKQSLSPGIKTGEFDVAGLPGGVYFLNVYTAKGSKTHKVVIK